MYGLSEEEARTADAYMQQIGFEHFNNKPDENRLGWSVANLKWLFEHPEAVEGVLQDAEYIRNNFRYVIFCGMGGSGLSVQTVKTTFGEKDVKIYSLRTTDPAVIKDILEDISANEESLESALKKTLIIPISKSGKTEETVSHKKYFENLFGLYSLDIKEHMWVVTDTGSPMDTGEYTQREIQLNKKGDIGRRFTSPTTNIFLLPLALVSNRERVWKILRLAREMNDIENINDNIFLKLGAFLYYIAKELGKDKLTMLMPEELRDIPLWAEQLFKESLGKDGKGITLFYGENITPEVLRPVNENDRLFFRINLRAKKTKEELWNYLSDNNYPLFEIEVEDIDAIGGIMLGLQRAVAVVGYLWGICFVDQPAVEGYKKATTAVMNSLQPGQKVEVPKDWKHTTYKNLKLYYSPLLDIGAITEEELQSEVANLGSTLDDAPAVYAAIIKLLIKKPGF